MRINQIGGDLCRSRSSKGHRGLSKNSENGRCCVLLAPTAVALVMPGAPEELDPMKVFSFSIVFDAPARLPTKVLSMPVVLEGPANTPKKEFEPPVVFERPAAAPKAIANAVSLNGLW